MKVLFVWPVTTFSVWDVARGYRHAMARELGEDNIRDYHLNKRTEYHRRALSFEGRADDIAAVAQLASEQVLAEALYFGADVVFIVSGLNFHPVGIWLLDKVGVHAAVVMTESPYDDENQADWASACPGITVFTNEVLSSEQYGWNYLPHAYDPAIHRPIDPPHHDRCDVLMVATGWKERQEMLELVNWDGIDFRLFGIWPNVTPASPLYRRLWPVCVDNTTLPPYYTGAKICINVHRHHPNARSLNPRAFEIAACGAFQISDVRAEGVEIFGDTMPTFSTAKELEELVRYYLDPAHEQERLDKARGAQFRARDYTFDIQVSGVIDTIRHDAERRRFRQRGAGMAVGN